MEWFQDKATPAEVIDSAKRYFKHKDEEKSYEKNDFNSQYHRHSMYWLGFSLLAMIGYAFSSELSSAIAEAIGDEDDFDDDDDDDDD